MGKSVSEKAYQEKRVLMNWKANFAKMEKKLRREYKFKMRLPIKR